MALSLYNSPGKFEGELALAQFAYEATLDGLCDPYDFGHEGYVDFVTVCEGPLEIDGASKEAIEAGLTDEDIAYAASLIGFIVHEDNYGFVHVAWFEPGEEKAFAKAIDRLEREQEKHDEQFADDCY